jgi:hypothetical protein
MDLQGQDPLYWQLTDEDGLPSNTVYSIIQDSTGYIWLGTSDGLVRYNGNELERIEHPKLLDNEIIQIKKDPFGNVWFNNLGGQIFSIKNGKPEILYNLELSDSFRLNSYVFLHDTIVLAFNPTKIVQNSQNVFFVINGIEKENRFAKHSKRITSVNNYWYGLGAWKDSLAFLDLGYNKSKNTFEFSFWRGLPYEMEKISGIFKDFRKFNFGNVNGRITHLKPVGSNHYFFERNVLKKFSWHNGELRLEKVFEFSENIQTINVSKEQLYIFTDAGFYKLNNTDVLQGPILKNFHINTGIVDAEGNLWLCTKSDGVLVVPFVNSKVINHSSVSLIVTNPENQELFIGYSNSRIDIFKNGENIQKIDSIFFPGNFNVRSIKEVNQDTLLIATDDLVYFYSRKRRETKEVTVFPHSTKDVLLIKDSLYLATHNSLKMILLTEIDNIKKKSNNRNELRLAFSAAFQVLGVRTNSLAVEDNNKIWIGTSQGLYTYKSGVLKQMNDENGNPINASITSIKPDSSDLIFVGSSGSGLYRVEKEKCINVGFKGSQYEVPKIINDFAVQDLNEYWIGSNTGLYYWNLKSGISLKLNKSSSLLSNEIKQLEILGNNLFVGTESGLFVLEISDLISGKIYPKVVLNEVSILQEGQFVNNGQKLEHESNFLTFTYSGLSYKSKSNVDFKYRLIGLDSNWILTSGNKIQFPGLTPGKYQFQVAAINHSGLESKMPATFDFRIMPPWYKTWWFFTLLTLMLLILVWTIFQVRYATIKRREKMKREFSERVNRLRMEALQTQMNPHFIFNAMNAIQHYLTLNDGENAMRYLAKFARLIRLIFEHSKEKMITLEEELELLNLYFHLETLRFGDKILTKIEVDKKLQDQKEFIKIPPLIIQPIVENSFRHGLLHKNGKGIVSVHFTYENGHLKCIIEDDGIGLEKAAQLKKKERGDIHRSSGIHSAKERLAILHNTTIEQVELLNYFKITDLSQESGYTSGTRVELIF